MKQQKSAVLKQEDTSSFEKWCFQQTVEIEHSKQELEDSKKNVEQRQKELDKKRRQFEREREMELDRMKREQHLFDMKFQILEGELKKLAAERERVERQKAFYNHVHEYEKNTSNSRRTASNVVKGELFFMGVGNESALRKRYKDLIKIYHPDNLDGDTGTIQEINREYDALKKKLDSK